MVVSRVCMVSSCCKRRLVGLFQSLLAAQFTDRVLLVNQHSQHRPVANGISQQLSLSLSEL